MALNTKRNDIIMNTKSAEERRFGIGEAKIGPVREELARLQNSIAVVQGNHRILEDHLSPVCSPYPDPNVKPSNGVECASAGCQLADDICTLIRTVNALADRQEAMIRAIQL